MWSRQIVEEHRCGEKVDILASVGRTVQVDMNFHNGPIYP